MHQEPSSPRSPGLGDQFLPFILRSTPAPAGLFGTGCSWQRAPSFIWCLLTEYQRLNRRAGASLGSRLSSPWKP
jgi:hypothetical protein